MEKNKIKEKQELSCQNATKMISGFIRNTLGIQELELFMNHIEHCPNCREELSIQFLIHAGLVGLEDGENYDLQAELDEALEDAHRKIRMHHCLKQSVVAVEIVGILALLIVAIIMIK